MQEMLACDTLHCMKTVDWAAEAGVFMPRFISKEFIRGSNRVTLHCIQQVIFLRGIHYLLQGLINSK